MNPMSSENRPLIPLDKWEDIFQSSDENKLNDEVSSLRYAMDELKSQVKFVKMNNLINFVGFNQRIRRRI